MTTCDFSATRLFVDAPLAPGGKVALERAQANYLLSVLRLGAGDGLLVFNGRDGEWRARLAPEGRKAGSLAIETQARPQPAPARLDYLFAPLKHARLDYMVQKAVEMGVGRLRPVFTHRTVASRVNYDRMRANAIEAAEQCGILAIPEILPEARLGPALESLGADRVLIVCDEDAPVCDPIAALAGIARAASCALLVGPEGGFAEDERRLFRGHPNVRILSLGPRILRADTAAVAALAVIQAVVGDWRGEPEAEA